MTEQTILRPDLSLAADLFAKLHEISFDGVGITRDTYGAGEQAAHDLMESVARKNGLEVRTDAALNLYITLPGQDRSMPAVMTGSHLDSVPRGGNFDGAAGVVAGVSILAGWVRASVKPLCDVTVIGLRAEESAWFPVSYIGSKAAFGLLDAQAMEVRRFDTGCPLSEHLIALGGSPDLIREGIPTLDAKTVNCFIELHIEQGPVLVDKDYAVGIVTGICGSLRYRHAQVTGQYAHSGATPHSHRHDAVVAVSELIVRLQHAWCALEEAGHELTLTFGQVNTDEKQADFSKVSGHVRFCIDIRSRSLDSLQTMNNIVQNTVQALQYEHGVQFDLGPSTGSQPAIMNSELLDISEAVAQQLGCTTHRMPSGAGHDTAIFSNQGIATAMLFVRNTNGSHNPQEAMDLTDFCIATHILAQVMGMRAGLIDASHTTPFQEGNPLCQHV